MAFPKEEMEIVIPLLLYLLAAEQRLLDLDAVVALVVVVFFVAAI